MNDDWHMLAEEERLFCDVLTRICGRLSLTCARRA